MKNDSLARPASRIAFGPRAATDARALMAARFLDGNFNDQEMCIGKPVAIILYQNETCISTVMLEAL